MLIIGLTGGIGSGKTAASDHFQQLGITIVDADVASRTVVEPGKPALKKISERFGPEMIQEDGGLNRALMRTRVFATEEDRLWLESLLHPLIAEEIIQGLKNSKSPYSILVSPLLLETAQATMASRILVIDVPVDLQVERTMSRDNNSEEQVRAIVAAQSDRQQRLAKADDVIVNDQDLKHLHQEVEKLHQTYLKLAENS
ncbi:MAG: dephospho-CoA kinase [Pseudomonadales bacterium]|nr:dephospho-CoA kinase [Pseudomonadales bacterium]